MTSPKLLHDMRILCTSLTATENEFVTNLAREQGAVVLTAATATDPPHVFIARRVGTPKYHRVLRNNPSTPVVTPDWLTASVAAGQRLPHAEYALKAFAGLTICFSGLPVFEKERLAQDVVAHGGRHSPSLSKHCTHLLTQSTKSDKYSFAKNHGIPCLHPSWLEDSVAAGWCQEERRYIVATITEELDGFTSAQVTGTTGRPCTTSTRDLDDDDRTAGELIAAHVGQVRVAPQSNHHQQQEQRQAALAGVQCKDASCRDNTESKTTPCHSPSSNRHNIDNHTDQGATRKYSNDAAPCSWDDVAEEFDQDDGPLPLESCYIWVVGCTGAQMLEALKLCRCGGAKRFIDPHPTLLTHIVVGSNISVEEARNASDFVAVHRDVAVVGLEWLRRCVARHEVMPADERFVVSLNLPAAAEALRRAGSLPAAAHKGAQKDAAAVGDCINAGVHVGVGPRAGGCGDGESRAAVPDAGGNDPATMNEFDAMTKHTASQAMPSRIFEGCYFTLAAIRKTSEEGVAESLIRLHGGRLFTSSVPAGGKAYAICPASLPSNRAGALRRAHTDFASVPGSNWFTLYWVECCITSSRVLAPARNCPCFQPLPYELPLPGMERVRACVSGYNDPSTRNAIFHTVQTLGGKTSPNFMSKDDTHLIIRYATGKKYVHAGQWQIMPVTADWLIDTALTGRLQPEEPYCPPQPPAPSPTHAQPVRAAEVPGIVPGGNSNPSQIGATQFPGDAAAAAGVGIGGDQGPSLFQAVLAGPKGLAKGKPAERSKATRQTTAAKAAIGKAGAKKPTMRERVQHLREASKKRTKFQQSNSLRLTADDPADGAKPPPQQHRQRRQQDQKATEAVPRLDLDSMLGLPTLDHSKPIDATSALPGAAAAAVASIAMAGFHEPQPPSAALVPTLSPPAMQPQAAERENDALSPGSGGREESQEFPKSRGGIAPPRAATRASARLKAGGSSETQPEDADLAAFVDNLACMLEQKSSRPRGSQQEMMPPPLARDSAPTTREKRNRLDDAASAPLGHAGTSRRSVRRTSVSGNNAPGTASRDAAEHLGFEMSQQVGYEAAPAIVTATIVGAQTGSTAEAKQRLQRAVTRHRRGLNDNRGR